MLLISYDLDIDGHRCLLAKLGRVSGQDYYRR